MRIVREIMPNRLPLLFQAVTDDDNNLQSVDIYPIENGKILERMPNTDSELHLIATMRLADISAENN
jgi:hypothetical protein